MKIICYYQGLWYAAKFADMKTDAYELAFNQLESKAHTEAFFRKYKYNIGAWYQNEIKRIAANEGYLNVTAEESEFWADIVRRQANELDKKIEEVMDLADQGMEVGFDDIFEEYEGNEQRKYPAFKCYGIKRGISTLSYPSLIRIYALKVGKAWVMAYGGIKINNPISSCPVLKNNVNRRITAVGDYLAEQQVKTEGDLERISE